MLILPQICTIIDNNTSSSGMNAVVVAPYATTNGSNSHIDDKKKKDTFLEIDKNPLIIAKYDRKKSSNTKYKSKETNIEGKHCLAFKAPILMLISIRWGILSLLLIEWVNAHIHTV